MENKYTCPKCGATMESFYEKPALNLTCPKCGCKIATTRWEDIDLDMQKYSIYLNKIDNPNISQIKFISNYTGKNFIESKKILLDGGLLFEGQATSIVIQRKILNDNFIKFTITPDFKY